MKALIVVNNLRVANGVATTIMNQYDSLIKNGVQVDFMQFLNFESPYIEKIEGNNGNIITISKNYSGIKKIKRYIKNNQYDIIHINQMNLQTVLLIMYAKLRKTKSIIYHSHNTKVPGGIKRKALEKLSNLVYALFANKYIACSKEAGIDSFGKKKKFTVLKNSIDVKKFKFNNDIRKKIRNDLKISDDTFVVGTVCRYAYQKNPLLMIDIVSKIIEKRPKTVFLWVGSAPSEDDPILKQMRDKIKELNIEKNMLWVGSKSDIYNWYSAMDVFLMPSRWEGLGITYLEAQANSLPVFASDVVPEDTKITDLIEYISLDKDSKFWADRILKYNTRKENMIKDYANDFIKAGYDLEFARDDLLKIYLES